MCKKRLRNPAITAIFAVSNFEIRGQKFAPVTSHPWLTHSGRHLSRDGSRFVAKANPHVVNFRSVLSHRTGTISTLGTLGVASLLMDK